MAKVEGSIRQTATPDAVAQDAALNSVAFQLSQPLNRAIVRVLTDSILLSFVANSYYINNVINGFAKFLVHY